MNTGKRMVRSHIDQHVRACRWGGEELLLLINGDLEKVRCTRTAVSNME